tara:strand:- start:741 stop:2240 length:1500 start_codon:yes stop_codon:yes gene_type:complete
LIVSKIENAHTQKQIRQEKKNNMPHKKNSKKNTITLTTEQKKARDRMMARQRAQQEERSESRRRRRRGAVTSNLASTPVTDPHASPHTTRPSPIPSGIRARPRQRVVGADPSAIFDANIPTLYSHDARGKSYYGKFEGFTLAAGIAEESWNTIAHVANADKDFTQELLRLETERVAMAMMTLADQHLPTLRAQSFPPEMRETLDEMRVLEGTGENKYSKEELRWLSENLGVHKEYRMGIGPREKYWVTGKIIGKLKEMKAKVIHAATAAGNRLGDTILWDEKTAEKLFERYGDASNFAGEWMGLINTLVRRGVFEGDARNGIYLVDHDNEEEVENFQNAVHTYTIKETAYVFEYEADGGYGPAPVGNGWEPEPFSVHYKFEKEVDADGVTSFSLHESTIRALFPFEMFIGRWCSCGYWDDDHYGVDSEHGKFLYLMSFPEDSPMKDITSFQEFSKKVVKGRCDDVGLTEYFGDCDAVRPPVEETYWWGRTANGEDNAEG